MNCDPKNTLPFINTTLINYTGFSLSRINCTRDVFTYTMMTELSLNQKTGKAHSVYECILHAPTLDNSNHVQFVSAMVINGKVFLCGISSI